MTQRRPTLELQCASQPLSIPVSYLLNVGYAGRNHAAVQQHLQELARMGVSRPRQIPTVYPVSNNLATTSSAIQVQHQETSGEVEYVVVVGPRDLYVTVGSDHSDRALEQKSVSLAKQVCPNIVAPAVWRYQDVKGHWDELILRSWVSQKGDWRLYQEGTLGDLLPVEELLGLSREVLGARNP